MTDTTPGTTSSTDTTTNRPTMVDTAKFIKSIFTVRLATSADAPNGDFTTHIGIVGHSTKSDDADTPGAEVGNPIHDPAMKAVLADIGDQWNALPSYFSRGKCRDTSIGGNDAINCYQQFCENDDIAEHPFLKTNPSDPLSGMGRVCSEVYNDQQQIMYITFGVPRFNILTSFYGTAINENLAKLMNGGNSAGDIGRLVGAIAGQFINLPAVPIAFIANIYKTLTSTGMSKYYDFQTAMPLYYRCVNSMIIHLTINLGLSKDVFSMGGGAGNIPGGNISSLTPDQQALLANMETGGDSSQGLPDIFKNTFDIYKVLCAKKYKYMNASIPTDTSDDALASSALVDTSTTGNFAQNFITTFEAQLYDASLYIGFKIEKGVDTSESFSNETGPSSVAQQVNSIAEQAREAKFKMANGAIDGGVISGFLGAIGDVLSGAVSAIGGATIEQVMAGAGVIDFPDIWKSSSFTKNYHFNMSLRTPYGDPYSILQNLYIPLTLLLAGALPRGIGQASYTAPFVCRAYCRGMFAVPLGMITSMTVKRGADQFGWSTGRLPTCIDVSFEIKDLSPAMYLAIGDGGTMEALTDLTKAFGTNSNFQEYLMTLSGMGLADRLMWFRNLRRKAQYLLGQLTSTKLSPFYWGATLGNTVPARLISLFVPSTKIPPD